MLFLTLLCFCDVPSFADTQERYLLITNDLLKESFQQLVDRRCSQGMDGILITVEDINDSSLYSGKDIQGKIRNCIQSFYNPNQSMYLVLGGDETIVPVRSYGTGKMDDTPPMDLYYADMDGTNWDADEDGIYGEISDVGLEELTPEICFGRIPVSESNQVTAYYGKLERYEDDINKDEFVDSMLLLSGVGYDTYYEGPGRPERYRDHDPVSGKEVEMTDIFYDIIQPYWQPGKLNVLYNTNTSWDTNRFGDYDITRFILSDVLNIGFHYVYYWQESNASSWWFEDDENDRVDTLTPIRASRLRNLLPSIIFARGCGTAYYQKHDVTLCEALIQNPNGGAIALFGSSRSTSGSLHWDQILQNMFQEKHYRLGDAYRACLTARASQASVNESYLWHQYIFVLLGDPALVCHKQTKKTFQLISPKGNEIIDNGSDLYIRWNAAGAFSPENTVYLEYSDDDGQNWYPIPDANNLPYNAGCFIWPQCPLENGSNYQVRVLSTSNTKLSSESKKSFTIASMGELTIKSWPLYKVPIEGTHCNQTELICSAVRNSIFEIIVPQNIDGLDFAGWIDTNDELISKSNELQFKFDHNMTILAQYDRPGEGMIYYINDQNSENGIAPGNNDNDGLSPDSPMASIQMLLDRYAEIGYEDTIYISDGRYFENIFIDSNHTGVTFEGAGHDRSIIDGNEVAGCVVVASDMSCHFKGLGFENGISIGHSGALHLGSGQVKCTIRDCRFEGNTSPQRGGAIYLSGSPALVALEVYNSLFINNHSNRGGAISSRRATHAEFYNCTFVDNNTTNGGGVLMIEATSSMYLINCSFEGNTANYLGGAIYLRGTAICTAKLCTFNGNESIAGGGAICIDSENNETSMFLDECKFFSNAMTYNNSAIYVTGNSASMSMNKCLFESNYRPIVIENSAQLRVHDCTFSDNQGVISQYDNAPVFIDQSQFVSNIYVNGGVFQFNSPGDSNQALLEVVNSIFEGNLALSKGGVLWCNGDSNDTITIRNCTFFGNNVTENGSVFFSTGMPLTITNSIVWGNGSQQLYLSNDSIVSNSNIEETYQNFHNISEDPLFFLEGFLSDNGTPENEDDDFWVPGDYHLQSQTGRWDPVSIEWVNDIIHSPCIDAGDPNSPVGDELYPNGNRINMGAYGGTDQASMSKNLTP